MSLQGLFDIKKIKNPNPGRWKANNLVDPVLFSLVYQVSGGAYLWSTIFVWDTWYLFERLSMIKNAYDMFKQAYKPN